jgi:hypothetical protein
LRLEAASLDPAPLVPGVALAGGVE